jgi:hypothetical protein
MSKKHIICNKAPTAPQIDFNCEEFQEEMKYHIQLSSTEEYEITINGEDKQLVIWKKTNNNYYEAEAIVTYQFGTLVGRIRNRNKNEWHTFDIKELKTPIEINEYLKEPLITDEMSKTFEAILVAFKLKDSK